MTICKGRTKSEVNTLKTAAKLTFNFPVCCTRNINLFNHASHKVSKEENQILLSLQNINSPGSQLQQKWSPPLMVQGGT